MITPILIDHDAACAEQKIHEIAEIIYKDPLNGYNFGLLHGKIGIAIFLLYYWKWSRIEKFYNKALNLLETSINDSDAQLLMEDNSIQLNTSFEYGLSGVGWGIELLLRNNYFDGELDDIMEEFDKQLFRHMIDCIKRINNRCWNDAIGIALYCLKCKSLLSQEYLRRFISELDQIISHRPLYLEHIDHGTISRLLFVIDSIKSKIKDITSITSVFSYIYKIAFKIQDTQFQENEFSLNNILSKVILYYCTKRENILMSLMKIGKNWLESPELKKMSIIHFDEISFIAHIYQILYNKTNNITSKNISVLLFRHLLNNATLAEPKTKYKVWPTIDSGLYTLNLGLSHGIAGIGLILLMAINSQIVVDNEYMIFQNITN